MSESAESAVNALEPAAVATAVRDMIGGVRAAAPLRAGDLILIPLAPAPERPERPTGYLPLGEALSRHLVAITEQPQAQVPGLLAVSVADEPIVLVGGEQVLGGLQNRVLNTTILLAPHVELQIPVTCVEAGRWHGATYAPPVDAGEAEPDAGANPQRRRGAFMSGETAYASLRKTHTKAVSDSLAAGGGHHSDQGAVWGEVAHRLNITGSSSESSAMEALYHAPERARVLKESVEALRRPAGAIGFVAVLRGSALGAEIFADEALAEAYWEKLARSYALEALDTEASPRAETSAERAEEPAAEASEARLLADALAAEIQVHPSPGLGADARLAGSHVSGAGLVYEGQAIHLSLFPEEPDAPTSAPQRPARRQMMGQR
jgi:hypothetical protein